VKQSVVFEHLAVRHLAGELPEGRSHFPKVERGDRFGLSVRPDFDFILGNVVECFAVPTFRLVEYSGKNF